LVLIGLGLILLAGLTWILLPKTNDEVGAGSQDDSFDSVSPIAVDYPAPALSLVGLDGEPVSLDDHLGQVVLVNNWAIWCPPCKAEMPVLQDYFESYRRQGFTIIGIESGEPIADVVAFVEQYGLSFPVWPDQSQKALVAFQNGSLPSSYVIDRQGQVRFAWTGAINREMLEKFVTPLIMQ